MDADLPLKLLFQERAGDLLPLTGDAGALVHSAQVVELGAARRTVDMVVILSRDGERYARHIEFQTRQRAISPAAASSTRRASSCSCTCPS